MCVRRRWCNNKMWRTHCKLKVVALRKARSLFRLVCKSLHNGDYSSSFSSFSSSSTTSFPSLWSFTNLRYESLVYSTSHIHILFGGCLAIISPFICANSSSLNLLVVNLNLIFFLGSNLGVDPTGISLSPTVMVFYIGDCTFVSSSSSSSSLDVKDMTC